GPNSSFNIPVLSTLSTFWCSPPDLIAISYIPLKIAASEWIVVIDYLTRVIEVVEAGLKKPKESRGSVSYYESQLRTLHPLRRRCIQYIQDIKASQDGIVLHRNFSDSYLDLISDYTYLTAQMESVKTRIDGMVA